MEEQFLSAGNHGNDESYGSALPHAMGHNTSRGHLCFCVQH